MLKAILFDMDDTLLDNGEAYHSNLVKWWVEFVEGRFPSVDAASATQAAMQAVLAKNGTGPTNLETLDSTLSEETGLDWQTLAGLFSVMNLNMHSHLSVGVATAQTNRSQQGNQDGCYRDRLVHITRLLF